MNTNERFNKLEEVVSEILIDTHKINQRLDNFENTFNKFGEVLIDKFSELTKEVKGMREDLKGVRQDLQQLHDHEERIRKLENYILQKGA